MSNKTYEIYEKYIKQLILNREKFDPMIFITQTIKIADNSMAKDKNKKIKIIDDKKELSGLCDFISNIYIDIYKFLGYENYEGNLWILKIERNVKKIIKAKKSPKKEENNLSKLEMKNEKKIIIDDGKVKKNKSKINVV
jgi:hypothetical protein